MKKSYHLFLLLAVINLFIDYQLQAQQERKNVIFIMADDFNYWTSKGGYYPQAQTPNLDALANKGIFFSQAHSSSPVCNPSRNALMSGIRPSTSTIDDNGAGFIRDIPGFENVVTMNQHFKNNGYYVYGAGKIYHPGRMDPTNPEIDPANWSELNENNSGCRGGSENSYEVPSNTSYRWSANPSPMSEENCADFALAKDVERLLEDYDTSENKDKPFFIATGLFRPHMPWNSPKEFWDIFDGQSFPPPPAYNEALDEPGNSTHEDIQRDGKWEQAIQAYLASCALADYNVGVIMHAVENSPYRDNTLVVFMGDHGWHLGEKGHWGKFTTWDEANHTSMIIYDPSAPGNGQTCDKVVSLQDVYPTLVEATGLPYKYDIEGRSLIPLLENPKRTDWDHPILMSYRGTNFMKGNQWRFIEGGTNSKLFNINDDPYEWNNLYGQSAYDEVVANLRGSIDSIVQLGQDMRSGLKVNEAVNTGYVGFADAEIKVYRKLPVFENSSIFSVAVKSNSGDFQPLHTYGIPIEPGVATQTEHLSYFGFKNGGVIIRVSMNDGTPLNEGIIELVNKTYGDASAYFEDGNMFIKLLTPKKSLLVRLKNDIGNPLMIFADSYDFSPIPEGANVFTFEANSETPYIIDEEFDRYTVPNDIDVVVVEDGALVQGTIHGRSDRSTPLLITGGGVILGNGPIVNGSAGLPYNTIEFPARVAMTVEGVSILKSRHFGMRVGRFSHIDQVKILGYDANNDGIVANNNSVIENCFLKVNDDHIKLYYDNIVVRNCNFFAQTNGAIFQLAWNNIVPGSNCLVENCEVLDVQYGFAGDPRQGQGGIARTFLSLRESRANPVSENNIIRNILVQGQLKRFIGINGLTGEEYTSSGPVSLTGYKLENIEVVNSPDFYSWVYTDNETGEIDITFDNVTLGGQCIDESNFQTEGNVNLNFTNCSKGENDNNPYTYTRVETFDEVDLFSGSSEEIVQNATSLEPGTGRWYGIGGNNSQDYMVYESGGNEGAYLGRFSKVPFARGTAYVYNNSNLEIRGVLDMSFDYFWTLEDNRVSYRVYGINDDDEDGLNGTFSLAGGGGTFGDNSASEYLGDDGTILSQDLDLDGTEGWQTINFNIDATGYEYIIIVLANVYGSEQTEDVSQLFGLDNVTVPFKSLTPVENFKAMRTGLNGVQLKWDIRNERLTRIDVARKLIEEEEFSIIASLEKKTEFFDDQVTPEEGYLYKLITYQETTAAGQSEEILVDPFSLIASYKNADRKSDDNQIALHLRLDNVGNSAVSLAGTSLRYWFSAENMAPLNAVIDYAVMGKQNITAAIYPVEKPKEGATHYLQLNFAETLPAINPGQNSGIIQLRIHKQDWSVFDETNDHSYEAYKTAFSFSDRITVYQDDVLIWGAEPVDAAENLSLYALHKIPRGNNPTDNSIKPHIQIVNDGNVSVDLNDVEVRYWFSSEGATEFNFFTDYAKIGKNNILGTLVDLGDLATNLTSHYVSLTFTEDTGELGAASSTGEIQTRFNEITYADFDETNDYSYSGTYDYTPSNAITLYYKGELIAGEEPGLNQTVVNFLNTQAGCGALGPRLIFTVDIEVEFDQLIVERNGEPISPAVLLVDTETFGETGIYRIRDADLASSTPYDYEFFVYKDGKLFGNGTISETTTASCDTSKSNLSKTKNAKNIEEAESISLIAVYPNPFAENVRIRVPRDFTSRSITITDMLGREVYRQKVEDLTGEIDLEVSGLVQGTYILTVLGASGATKSVKLLKN